jgi:hypothetical protein
MCSSALLIAYRTAIIPRPGQSVNPVLPLQAARQEGEIRKEFLDTTTKTFSLFQARKRLTMGSSPSNMPANVRPRAN